MVNAEETKVQQEDVGQKYKVQVKKKHSRQTQVKAEREQAKSNILKIQSSQVYKAIRHRTRKTTWQRQGQS